MTISKEAQIALLKAKARIIIEKVLEIHDDPKNDFSYAAFKKVCVLERQHERLMRAILQLGGSF